ncbi:MAG: hypothetical protein ACRELV_12690 [Longimicrobiales bacterium]
MKRILTSLWVATSAACGPAIDQAVLESLAISARDGLAEALTSAATWSQDAELRWIEGHDIDASGRATPGAGAWIYVFEAPGVAEQLAVAVSPRELEEELRPRRSPTGVVVGDAPLPADWIDSTDALERVSAAEPGLADGALSVSLLPTRPAQWIIRADGRTWRLDARSGDLVGP